MFACLYLQARQAERIVTDIIMFASKERRLVGMPMRQALNAVSGGYGRSRLPVGE
jgi:hypothetical protein